MITFTDPAYKKIITQLQKRGKLVDQKSNVYLSGMIVDYVRNGLNEGFEFRNPNERDRCGCGESFRI